MKFISAPLRTYLKRNISLLKNEKHNLCHDFFYSLKLMAYLSLSTFFVVSIVKPISAERDEIAFHPSFCFIFLLAFSGNTGKQKQFSCYNLTTANNILSFPLLRKTDKLLVFAQTTIKSHHFKSDITLYLHACLFLP